MIKACVFDLDGTLLDTLQDLSDSANQALMQHHLPQRTATEIQSFVGNGVAQLISRAVPEGTTELVRQQVFADFIQIYDKNKSVHTAPYPGIDDLLETLRLSGIRLAVFSNKPDAAVAELIAGHFPQIFDYTLGECKDLPKKPAPDGLRHIINHLGLNPEELLYIGDSEVDIATAKAAGVCCVSVLWGFRSRSFLEECGATELIDVPEALLPYLFNMEAEDFD